MLTGIGGDELYAAARRLPYAAVLSRDVRPHPRHLLSAGVRVLAPHVRSQRSTGPGDPRRAPVARQRAKDARRRNIGARSVVRAPPPPRANGVVAASSAISRVSSDALGLIAHATATRCWRTRCCRRASGTPWRRPRPGWVLPAARKVSDACSAMLLPPEIVERTSKTNFNHVFMDRAHVCIRLGPWDGTGCARGVGGSRTLAHHWRGEPQPSPQSGLFAPSGLAQPQPATASSRWAGASVSASSSAADD